MTGPKDWRDTILDTVRALTAATQPSATETRKWKKPSNPEGVPVWEQDGILFTGERYKDKIKLTFAKGASLPDPAKLFNASLDAGTRRAIDLKDGDALDAAAFKALVAAAARANAKG